MTESIAVTANGRRHTVPATSTIADVVGLVAAGQHERVAVAVNGEVVPRSEWHTAAVHDGDAIEVVAAIQGG